MHSRLGWVSSLVTRFPHSRKKNTTSPDIVRLNDALNGVDLQGKWVMSTDANRRGETFLSDIHSPRKENPMLIRHLGALLHRLWAFAERNHPAISVRSSPT